MSKTSIVSVFPIVSSSKNDQNKENEPIGFVDLTEKENSIELVMGRKLSNVIPLVSPLNNQGNRIGSKVNTNEVWIDAKINDKNEIGGKKRKFDR
jgi:hypothetical protein